MDKQITPSDRIRGALASEERSRAWLARNTRIPPTTLDRKLRGSGEDFTLAQVHAIASALDISVTDLVLTTAASDAA